MRKGLTRPVNAGPTIRVVPDAGEVRLLFDRLYAEYGPLNWWPADSDFEMIVGAILTQNTLWKNVEKALVSMLNAGFWSWEAIRTAEPDALAASIRPSGYYNQKAIKLQRFAEFLYRDYGGDTERLFAMSTAKLRETLLARWGIGRETADDILLYAAGRPVFVIDKYTMRLAGRLGWRIEPPDYEGHRAFFEARFPPDTALMGEFHAVIDRHSNRICRAKPRCAECPITDICATGRRA
jgi:endonuclease III related protein